MKRIIKSLGWVALILFLLAAAGLAGLVVFPFRIAFDLAFGWVWFLCRVVPEIHFNLAAIGMFLVATVLVVGGIHWLGRSISTSQGRRWQRRWSVGIYAATWLLFLTAMGVTGAVHQAGWLWRSNEPWVTDSYRYLNSYYDMKQVAYGVKVAVSDQSEDASGIRFTVIANTVRSLDSSYFQLFPPEGGPFRAALVLPRSQEVLKRFGFYLVRKNGEDTDFTLLKAKELEAALKELTAGRDYKPASESGESVGPSR
jgi:hypothetical protein